MLLGTMIQRDSFENMNAQVDKAVKVYKTAAQFPSILSAKICRKDERLLTVVSDWSQRNIERGKLTKYQRIHILNSVSLNLVHGLQNLPTADTTNELCSCVSKTEKLKAVIRDSSSDPIQNEKLKKQCLEIWQHGRLWKNLDLSGLNIHGEVYNDATFGCFEWDACEQKVLYIAEKKRPKTSPFYSINPVEEKPKGESSITEPVKGAEYDFVEDWGERLTGKSQSVLVVYDVTKEAPVVWDEGLPEGYSPGQVTWVPNLTAKRDDALGECDVLEDSSGAVGVAWKSEPRRFGLIFSTNYEGILFHANSMGKICVLRGGNGGISPRSPRFSPDGSRLVWLERPTGGTHNGSSRLMHCAWPPKDGTIEAEVIIDFEPKITSGGADSFCGVYCYKLLNRPFSKDGINLIFNSQDSTSVQPFVVNIETKIVSRLGLSLNGKPIESEDNTVSVLDVSNDIIVCTHTCMNMPHSLIVASLENKAAFHISSPLVPPEYMALKTQVFRLEGNDSKEKFTAIYYGPPEGKRVPLIVMPHGGPHSAFACEYSTTTSFFALLGFGMLLVNYRGSTGELDSTLKTLPGKIGRQDVDDVRKATSEAIKALPFLSPSLVFLFGGSHGGFLVTLLSGLFPEDYAAVAAISPSIDVVSKCMTSDIPDWNVVECGIGEWKGDGHGSVYDNLEALSKMRMVSPLVHANSVKAPTLVMVGSQDKRIPPFQGLLYYRCLKACKVKTRLLVYDDNHVLLKVPVELDSRINSALWFIDNMSHDFKSH